MKIELKKGLHVIWTHFRHFHDSCMYCLHNFQTPNKQNIAEDECELVNDWHWVEFKSFQ